MATDAPPPTNHQAAKGMPPVKPPSGRFIVQLFLIPGLIVAGAILVSVFAILPQVVSSTPESFLSRLENPNPDIRWRAAHELAQVLMKPESLELASDPDFALGLAEQLENALADLEKAERTVKSQLAVEFKRIDEQKLTSDERVQRENEAGKAAWRKLEPQRKLVLYLTSCLGNFNIPVGVPVLAMIATKPDRDADLKGLSLRQRRAVWALATLGNNLRTHYFGKNATAETKVLTKPQQRAILDKLAKATGGTDKRAETAKYALGVLEGKRPHEVDKALAMCAKSQDTFLREETAMALNVWDGPLTEPTLLLLSRDDGHGIRIDVTEDD
jgi:hypothetical protein